MAYEVRFSDESISDLALITEFLVVSNLGFGDTLEEAFTKAQTKVLNIKESIMALGHHPYRGSVSHDLLRGLRHLTKNRAITYFVINEETKIIDVMAIYFGGQDHQRHMIDRLLKQMSPDA